MDRDAALRHKLKSFSARTPEFFAKARRSTCAVYPYWPRAAALETATFYMNPSGFENFNSYHWQIMSARNLLDEERNEDFWEWVGSFPQVLNQVLSSQEFQAYFAWENTWLEEERFRRRDDLARCGELVELLRQDDGLDIEQVSVVLTPLKCVYSSDYHVEKNHFFAILGEFRMDSIIHELAHRVVHPHIEYERQRILNCDFRAIRSLDESYCLSGDEAGRLNAFEEVVVRKFTGDILAGKSKAVEQYISAVLLESE